MRDSLTPAWVMRLRWAVSLRSHRRGSHLLGLLLHAEDLSSESGWRVREDRRWTSGASGSKEDWAKRARAAKSTTVWRSFNLLGTADSWWLEITELVSESDADASLRSMNRYELPNPGFRGVIKSEHDVPLTIAESSTFVRVNDVEVDGQSVTTSMCSFTVKYLVVTIIGTASPEELRKVADIQAARIAESPLSHGSTPSGD